MNTINKVIELQNENMARVTPQAESNDLGIKPWEKKSIGYARARAYINNKAYNLFKDNVAGAKNFKKAQKQIAVEFLGGKVEWKDNKKFVMFQDGSQARY